MREIIGTVRYSFWLREFPHIKAVRGNIVLTHCGARLLQREVTKVQP